MGHLYDQIAILQGRVRELEAEVELLRTTETTLIASERSMLDLVRRCFERCQGMRRFSTDESDEYWTLAEELMDLEAIRCGRAVDRTDPDG